VKHARGFSLLEILVAFTILALSLGVLMQIFSGSLRNADVTRDAAQATALAQTLLAGAGVEAPLAAGESSGILADRFRWHLQVVPHAEGPRPGVSDNLRALPTLEMWRVTARVAWGEGDRKRDVTLTTLRVQRPSQQP